MQNTQKMSYTNSPASKMTPAVPQTAGLSQASRPTAQPGDVWPCKRAPWADAAPCQDA